MLKGVKMAIDEPIDAQRMRIVVMLTDGFIGNEAEIIEHVGEKCGDRVRFWAIGIGSSPNMFLIDGVARQGGGMGKELGLNGDPVGMAQETMNRIQRAQLSQVRIDWGDLAVRETYPARIPELWAGRPIVLFGRYAGSATQHPVKIQGVVEGEPVEWQVQADFPAQSAEHAVLASVWARHKIEDLMQQSYYQGSPAVEEEVTHLALDYRLMSPYTSFVAVDPQQSQSESLSPPVRMPVPVPLPEGAVWEGFFGSEVLRERESLAKGLPSVFFSRQTAQAPLAAAGFEYRRSYFDAVKGRAHFGVQLQPSATNLAISAVRSPQAPNRPNNWQFRGVAASGTSPASLSGKYRYSRGITAGRSVTLKYSSDGLALGQGILGMGGYPLILPDAVEPIRELMERLQQDVTRLQAEGHWEAAQDALAAWTLFGYFGGNPSEMPSDEFPSGTTLRQQQMDAWQKQLPALNCRVDLELRDMSLLEAVREVATAAGLEWQCVEGSVEDAGELLSRDELRIDYLKIDSRPAWETLDTLLFPVRMRWIVDDQYRIRVLTARRQPHRSAWVYRVGHMALPLQEELDAIEEEADRVAFPVRQIERFLEAVRQSVQLSDHDAIHLLVTGHLLVYGNASVHQRVADCLNTLAAEQAPDAPEEVRLLRPMVRQRLQQRSPDMEQRRKQIDQQRMATLHDQASWALLADAMVGRRNPQALTQLQIAWTDPVTREMATDDHHALLLTRSLWATQMAATSMPEAKDLQQLAQNAREVSRGLMERTARRMNGEPEVTLVWTGLLTSILDSDRVPLELVLQAAESTPDMTIDSQSIVEPVARTLLQQPDKPALCLLALNDSSSPSLSERVVLTAARLVTKPGRMPGMRFVRIRVIGWGGSLCQVR